MSVLDEASLGSPDLRIAGLSLWIQGRQFPDDQTYWDGNWLNVIARCSYPDATVSARGSIIHLSELTAFHRELEALHQALEGKAELPCMEPNLRVEPLAESLGHIRLTIEITPDNISQSHSFRDELDQTYLPPIFTALRAILEKYPMRDAEKVRS
jgi:hypothetical protein